MLTKFIQIIEDARTGEFRLETIFINVNNIIVVREDRRIQEINRTTPIVNDLRKEHQFTRITYNQGVRSHAVTVVGSPEAIVKLTEKTNHRLLRG